MKGGRVKKGRMEGWWSLRYKGRMHCRKARSKGIGEGERIGRRMKSKKEGRR